jgi:hypothetical protein
VSSGTSLGVAVPSSSGFMNTDDRQDVDDGGGMDFESCLPTMMPQAGDGTASYTGSYWFVPSHP